VNRISVSFEQARKTEEDARLVMTWRNDPHTREMFYHQDLKKWESFWQEYCSTYFHDEELNPLFAVVDGQRIGFVRFTPYSDFTIPGTKVDISINISPQFRNRGYGSRVLRAASHIMKKKYIDVIVAEIKRKNSASIRSFEKAGYRYLDKQEKKIMDTGEIVPIFRYTALLDVLPEEV